MISSYQPKKGHERRLIRNETPIWRPRTNLTVKSFTFSTSSLYYVPINTEYPDLKEKEFQAKVLYRRNLTEVSFKLQQLA